MFAKKTGDGQSYAHCRRAGESYAHRRWAGQNPLHANKAHGVPVHFLIVTIPINHTVAVIGSENTTTIDVRKHARAHTHTHTQTRMHTQTHEYEEYLLKPRPSTCASMPVHTYTHTYAHLHTPRRMNTQSIAWMIHLFCLLHGCFHSSSLWNCNKTIYACLRLGLLKSIEECMVASPVVSAILATTTAEDAAEDISKRSPALSWNGICKGNDSTT